MAVDKINICDRFHERITLDNFNRGLIGDSIPGLKLQRSSGNQSTFEMTEPFHAKVTLDADVFPPLVEIQGPTDKQSIALVMDKLKEIIEEHYPCETKKCILLQCKPPDSKQTVPGHSTSTSDSKPQRVPDESSTGILTLILYLISTLYQTFTLIQTLILILVLAMTLTQSSPTTGDEPPTIPGQSSSSCDTKPSTVLSQFYHVSDNELHIAAAPGEPFPTSDSEPLTVLGQSSSPCDGKPSTVPGDNKPPKVPGQPTSTSDDEPPSVPRRLSHTNDSKRPTAPAEPSLTSDDEPPSIPGQSSPSGDDEQRTLPGQSSSTSDNESPSVAGPSSPTSDDEPTSIPSQSSPSGGDEQLTLPGQSSSTSDNESPSVAGPSSPTSDYEPQLIPVQSSPTCDDEPTSIPGQSSPSGDDEQLTFPGQSSSTSDNESPSVAGPSSPTSDDEPTSIPGQSSPASDDEQLTGPGQHSLTSDDRPPTVNGQSSPSGSISPINNLVVPIQETGDRNFARLLRMPTTLVERNYYFMFMLLLLTIAELLENGKDEQWLRRWVRQFNVSQDTNIFGLLSELDRLDVISVLDLGRLREFLVNIGRMDVVYLIDRFLSGDYAPLRSINFGELCARETGIPQALDDV